MHCTLNNDLTSRRSRPGSWQNRVWQGFLSLLTLLACAGIAEADFVGIDASGLETNAGLGDPNNHVELINVFPSAIITDIQWTDVVYESFGNSWRSEVVFSLANSDRSDYWDFTISGQNSAGTHSSSGGVADMVLAGGPFQPGGGPFQLNNDGILRFEVYERHNDVGVNPDASFSNGSLQVSAVPEPSALLAIGLAAPAVCFSRRRRTEG